MEIVCSLKSVVKFGIIGKFPNPVICSSYLRVRQPTILTIAQNWRCRKCNNEINNDKNI